MQLQLWQSGIATVQVFDLSALVALVCRMKHIAGRQRKDFGPGRRDTHRVLELSRQ